jgi:hypothetical protein
MYRKRGRLDIDVESRNNEEQFASQFYNFMRTHPDVIISQVRIHKPIWICQCSTLTSTGSAPD